MVGLPSSLRAVLHLQLSAVLHLPLRVVSPWQLRAVSPRLLKAVSPLSPAEPFRPDRGWIFRGGFGVFVLGVMLVSLAGCREAPPEFESNLVRAISLEISRDIPTQAAMEDVEPVVEALFGTPQSPRWPASWMANDDQRNLVSVERLQVAAGGVSSNQKNAHTGLYQEHCVVCHGVSGSGAGPASRYQVPYPRDFRAGVFKWKSTARSEKPTREDLAELLQRGIPGTPMPSFSLLPPSDREAIIDYVIYLSVRGEVERELLSFAVDMLDYDTTPPEDELRIMLVSTQDDAAMSEDAEKTSEMPEESAVMPEELTEGGEAIAEVIDDVVGRWVSATSTPVPPRQELEGDELAASIARGKEIFHGQIANCAGCHGVGGEGGLPTLDYDDWTKDFTTRIGIDPTDKEAVKPFRSAGALPPRQIDPRVLTNGVFHGGDDPETLYRRIQHGIAGTPMPSVDISEEAAGKTGLSPDEAWDLVNYLRRGN
ncbi:cytochrome c [Rhodopirellula sallentina]|uniref:Cytochrome c class I n=2 Tax=Rhodopirellula TaxID=265488 RepID=M5TZ13_9BACT|nr:cytochrome c class I [Rhodopirellula sallentina SM41]